MNRETFIAQVRARRAMKIAAPRRRLPRQIPPDTIARDYARRLLVLVDRVVEAYAPLLAELPAILARVQHERGDGHRNPDTGIDVSIKRLDVSIKRLDAGEGSRIRQLLETAASRIGETLRQTDIERMARDVGQRTNEYNRVQHQRQVRAAFGVDLFQPDQRVPVLVDGFVTENVALIKDLPANLVREVEQRVTRALTTAAPIETVAKELDERFAFGRDRAKVIARDQVGKLYGQINVARQKEIGATHFIWRTVRDRRVRGTPGGAFPNAKPSHFDREGVRFAYDDPRLKGPGDGIPGVPILCRCYAEPVFDDILRGVDHDDPPSVSSLEPETVSITRSPSSVAPRTPAPAPTVGALLTAQERRLLELRAQGASDKKALAEMGVDRDTGHAIANSIRDKLGLGVGGSLKAAGRALRRKQ